MDERPLKERTLRGAVWATAGGNGAQVLAFILFVLISRVVGPSAVGVVAVRVLLIETARALTVESIAVNLVANGNLDRRDFNAGMAMSFSLSVAAAGALALAAPLAASVFGIADLAAVLPLLAPILPLHAVARLYEAELSLRMRFRALAVRSVGAAALGGVAGLSAAYSGQGVNALILQQWLTAAASLSLMAVQSDWRPSLAFDRDGFKRLARQSAVLAPAGVVTNLRQTIDGLAVASFSGAVAVGLYSLAKRTRLAFQLGFSSAIGRVSLPAFGALKNDPVRLVSAVEQATQLSAVVAFPIFLGVATIAPELIDVFLGPEWSAAAAPMALLMVGGAIAVATRLFENALLVCDCRGAVVATNVSALAALALSLVLFGRFGPSAVAAATAAVGVMQNLAAWILISRRIGLRHRFYLRRLLAPLLICLLMLAVISWLRGPTGDAPAIVRLILFVPAGAALYIAASWLLNRSAMIAALNAARIVVPHMMMRT
jgi:O-antigen/teichoic acid export membrane protein